MERISHNIAPLTLAIALTFVFSSALPYILLTARLFSLTPLPLQELVLVVGIAVLYVVVLDMIKVWYYQRREKDALLSSDMHLSALMEH